MPDARCPMPDARGPYARQPDARGPDSTSCYKAIHIICLRPGLYNLVSKAFNVASGFFVFLRTN
jgi:hypothetical protein